MSNSEEQEIDRLLDRAVDRLLKARGNSDRIRDAIGAYLSEGDRLEISPLELRDFFDISSPGLAELAGYSEAEQEEATQLYETTSGEHYEGL